MAKLSKEEKRAFVQEQKKIAAQQKNDKNAEKKGATAPSEFQSPLISEPVEEKLYGKKKVKDIGEIPEHNIEAKPIDVNKMQAEINPQSTEEEIAADTEQSKASSSNETTATASPNDQYNEPPPKVNKQFSEGSTASQNQNAEYLANIAIDFYKKLHEITGVWLKYDFDKMKAKAFAGKFNMAVLNMELPAGVPDPMTGEQEIISLRELMKQFNENVDSVLVVSEDFEEQVKPLLIAFLIEKGIGLTNNQSLLLVVAMDLGQKLTILGQQKISINGVTKQATLYFEQQTAANIPPPPPTEPTATDEKIPEPNKPTPTETTIEDVPQEETEEIIEPIVEPEEIIEPIVEPEEINDDDEDSNTITDNEE